jgi:hypothetical protein
MKSITLVLLALVFSITGFAQTDEAAIKEVLARETTSFFKHDFKAAYAEWHVVPQSTGIVSSLDGNVLFLTAKELSAAYTTKELSSVVFPDTFNRSDWLFRINPNSAYVAFNQIGLKEKEIVERTYETRYMEKVNNQWKIVSMTVVNHKK